jgi:hypothetical protein
LKVGENSMPFFTESIGYLMIRVNLKWAILVKKNFGKFFQKFKKVFNLDIYIFKKLKINII